MEIGEDRADNRQRLSNMAICFDIESEFAQITSSLKSSINQI